MKSRKMYIKDPWTRTMWWGKVMNVGVGVGREWENKGGGMGTTVIEQQ